MTIQAERILRTTVQDTVDRIFNTMQCNDTLALKSSLINFGQKYLRKDIPILAYHSINFYHDAQPTPQRETYQFLQLCRQLEQHFKDPETFPDIRNAFTELETALKETKEARYLDYDGAYSQELADLTDLKNSIYEAFPSLKWSDRKIPSAASMRVLP